MHKTAINTLTLEIVTFPLILNLYTFKDAQLCTLVPNETHTVFLITL